MAFPAISVVTSTAFTTSVTSMSVNLPASISSGDLLLAFVEVRNSGTWTVPTDWVEFKAQLGGGSVGELTAFYKIATGSEGSTASWTASTGTTAIWQVYKVTSWHGTTPPEASSSSGDFTTNPNPPSITPSWGADDTLWVEVAGNTATSTFVTGASTNYSGYDLDTASTGGAQCNIASAYRELNATSEDPGEMTNPGSIRWWAAMTIAVRPSASSGYTMTFGSGSYTYTGNNWSNLYNRLLTIAKGTYTYTGNTFTLLANRLLNFTKGTYTYTGNTINLLFNKVLSFGTGAYTYTGNTISFLRNYFIQINSGSYVYTGFNLSLKRILKLVFDTGSYIYTGFNLAFTKAYHFLFGSGSYTYTGFSLNLLKHSRLVFGSGSYTYTGFNLSLNFIRRMVFSAGSYTYTGVSWTYSRIYRLTISTGTYIYTGVNWGYNLIRNARGVLLRGIIKLRGNIKIK